MKYRHKHIHPKIRRLRHRTPLYKRPVVWITLLAVTALLGVAYVALFYSRLQITEILVEGNERVDSVELQTIVRNHAAKKIVDIGPLQAKSSSILIFNAHRVEEDILRAYPEIESAMVQKGFPHTATITIKERLPVAIFCAQECFHIDKYGVIFNEVRGAPGNAIAIRSAENMPVIPGQAAASEEIMAAVLQIEKNLQENFQVQVKEAVVGQPLIISTQEGWKLYLDTTSDMSAQIAKMNLLLKDEISEKRRKTLEYIYLQYTERAYYK